MSGVYVQSIFTYMLPSSSNIITTSRNLKPSSAPPHNLVSIMAALDPPPYLLSLQTNIRARPIPWDGAVRAGSISEWQLERVKAVDKVRRDVRVRTVEADVDGYVRLLVGADEGGGGDGSILDSARNRADIVQYVLVLAADLVQGRLLAAGGGGRRREEEE